MKLKNDYIQLTLDKKGAELKGIYNLETKQEVLWHGDKAWWAGISPILFPFVGTSMNHQYRFENKVYDIRPHGFLKDREFNVDEISDRAIWFSYTSTQADEAIYPFKFRVKVGYEINWSTIDVKWLVENLDDKQMYYTMGAHPAFLCDQGDVLRFNAKGETYFYTLKGPHIDQRIKQQAKDIVLNDDAFPIDTWIYDGIESVSLLNLQKGSSVKVSFADFKYVGIWSPIKNGKMAPFVCIEPWAGLPDFADAKGELTQRKTIIKLAPKKENAYKYSIEFA